MCHDLVESYLPSCIDCMHNKPSTTATAGTMHPLPIPDGQGDSVAIDFIGPLLDDQGPSHNTIVTITDCLNADLHIVPCRDNISAKQFTILFFDNWYCENGLPLDIVSDHDKLILSCFWKSLHKLTGIKLKMSSLYHPQMDGLSECNNKTINQCIQFHVERNLFPLREFPHPGPVITEDGQMENFIEKIIDEKHMGRGKRYLVHWVGFGADEDEWLLRRNLEDCETLDAWEQRPNSS